MGYLDECDDKAFKQGFKAFYDGIKLEQNPYYITVYDNVKDKDSSMSISWQKGWEAASEELQADIYENQLLDDQLTRDQLNE